MRKSKIYFHEVYGCGEHGDLPPELASQLGLTTKKQRKAAAVAIKIDKIGAERLCHYDSAKRYNS